MVGKTLLLAACAVLLLGSRVPAETTVFVSPTPNTWVSRSEHLVLKLNNPEVTAVRINVNGVIGDMLSISSPEYRKAFQDFLIVQPLWDQGRNEISVEAYVGKERAETAVASIYYAPGGDGATVPPEFKPFVFHLPDTENRCIGCHNMAPSPAQLLSTQERENPCFSCHRGMLRVPFVHGPAGTYSCVYCHQEKATPKYSVTKRDMPLCAECHEDKASEFSKRKYIHGPIAGGMCEVCHDPHGSANRAQLRMPINTLCLSCHEAIARKPHILRTPSGEGHPVSGRKDPSASASGRDMSCISCHNPHAADVRYFFVNNADDRMELCQMCHNK
jgi:predicted CXXCH cytochrome family protein